MTKPRVGVVGTGWWAGTAHLPALAGHQGSQLTAICEPKPERAREVAARFGVRHVFVDLDDLLAADVVDGLVIATPHTTHHALAKAALEAGVHVLVEKPLTTSAPDAFELVDLAESRGLHLTVGYTYHHTPAAAFVRDAVREEIGELVCVAAQFTSATQPLFGGGDTPGEDPDEADVPHPTTYADPARSGGGQGHTQVTHLMGAVNWTTGREVEEVFCYQDNRGLPVDLVDVMAFRFAGGGLGTVTSTGTAVDGQPPRHRIHYDGTRGTVFHDLTTGAATLVRTGGQRVECPAPSEGPAYPVGAPARAFAELLAGRGTNRAPGDEAAATVAFLDAAYRSAATGRAERVPRRGDAAH
ncbi:Predicted dehydrogenase [Actinopolymorpha cephalotaxi]|uniref:Dehydrogenase n=1 Tax=Actinopolymorpha cephalotaxi TaxID=504797 RepID=A0A1I2VEK5_9ACTN|nr:Gfo/Idh/MocA family oxidoreductase [Actinopolymorpha cephalotaxi]NYH84862.1 putative dehydrogenase [Actinopolymorpha cephalotaxi]SFG87775.1 Predicted dehydrogenase [Actinopolymorpha cephalotaxi]